MNRFVFFVLLSPAILLLGSTLGTFHGLGDSLAVFRFHLGFLTFISAFVLLRTGWKRLSLGATILGLAAIGSIWASYYSFTPPIKANTYSLYQKNTLVTFDDVRDLADDIQSKNTDFVTLQELPPKKSEILEILKEQYQTILFCPGYHVDGGHISGLGLASKFPAVPETKVCHRDPSYAAIKLITDDGPIWLVSLHLRWPFPFRQRAQVTKIIKTLEKLNAPIVLAGDFNMVPWSDTMTRIETATGSTRLGVTNGTFHLFNTLALPIDHVLAPTNCTGETSPLDLLGSDHHGVLARFTLESC